MKLFQIHQEFVSGIKFPSIINLGSKESGFSLSVALRWFTFTTNPTVCTQQFILDENPDVSVLSRELHYIFFPEDNILGLVSVIKST